MVSIRWTLCLEAILVFVTIYPLVSGQAGGVSAIGGGKEDGRRQRQLSFMWRIKRKVPAYFFGTIHVPYTRVWNSISPRVKRAFQNSGSVYFELDLLDPDTVSTLSDCQKLPDGKKLIEVLPQSLYKRLKRHLDYVRTVLPNWMTTEQRRRGLYPEYLFNAITSNWERKRPVWIMLMVNSLTESDIRSRGVPVLDMHLAQEARRLNKNIGAVENVEEQCLPLNGLNMSQVIFALNRTLRQHESIRRGLVSSPMTTDDLIQHYNCGNLSAVIFNQDTAQLPKLAKTPLSNSIQEDLKLANHIDDYFQTELIMKRNRRMAQRIVQLLDDNPRESFFFAFGAGHFLGNNSVVEYVEQAGRQVVRTSQRKRRQANCL
ncbi:Metalloprotease TIKI2 [Halotydeus destructor]|nr:Metalloprotease TIKI2 [Halotydeus destructor]